MYVPLKPDRRVKETSYRSRDSSPDRPAAGPATEVETPAPIAPPSAREKHEVFSEMKKQKGSKRRIEILCPLPNYCTVQLIERYKRKERVKGQGDSSTVHIH